MPGFEFDARARTNPGPAPSGARLLRSFLPDRSGATGSPSSVPRSHFRGAGTRVIIPIVAMMVFGAAVAVIAGANSSNARPGPASGRPRFPPATLAGNAFTVAANGEASARRSAR